MTSLEEAKLGARTNPAHTTARCTTSSNGERTLRVFFTLPCRGRVGERSAPGWGPPLREVGACGGTHPAAPPGRRPSPCRGGRRQRALVWQPPPCVNDLTDKTKRENYAGCNSKARHGGGCAHS